MGRPADQIETLQARVRELEARCRVYVAQIDKLTREAMPPDRMPIPALLATMPGGEAHAPIRVEIPVPAGSELEARANQVTAGAVEEWAALDKATAPGGEQP